MRRNAIGTVYPNPERQIAGLRRMLEVVRKIETKPVDSQMTFRNYEKEQFQSRLGNRVAR